jgi:hypothetical protein
MSDFFLRLAARSLDSPPAALPRIASRFETPGWDRSPQVDTRFARSAASEQAPPADAAVDARPHTDGAVLAASQPSTGMWDDGMATFSPRGSQVFAADAEIAARKTVPHTRASIEVPFESRAGLNTIESVREVEAVGPERSGQLARAPLAAIPAPDQIDRSSEAFGPIASARQAGTAPTAPAPMSRRPDEARNASSDITRMKPPSTDGAPAGRVRVEPGASQHARSRPVTPDLTRTAPDTPPAPEIHVSIGRIEVRAAMAPVTPTPRPRASATGPALSLEAYLRGRQEGSR